MAAFSYHRRVDPESQQPLPPHEADESAPSPRTPTERWEGLPRPDIDPQGTLYRPATAKSLWVVAALVLVALVAADLGVEHHAYFEIDGSFGFHAWYGFLACIVMVLFAKGVGVFLQRKDDFYDE